MQIPTMNGYSQLGTSLSKSRYLVLSLNFSRNWDIERSDKVFQGNYLDVQGGTTGSSGSMSGGSYGSSFGTCGRRHDSAMTAETMSGRCYWPESEEYIRGLFEKYPSNLYYKQYFR